MILSQSCQLQAVRPTAPLGRSPISIEPVQKVGVFTQRRSSVRVYAQQRFATQLIGGGLGANQVFVAGAEGQLGVRVVQKLLQGGSKVIAGVADEERAQSILQFATSVELLRKQDAQRLSLAEVDLADEDSILEALPKRGARVVVVVGEAAAKGSQKLDARAATRVLLAAQEANASQFVLVAPVASKGGGFLSNLFGGAGSAAGSGTKPSKLEQDIAASGLSFAIVRTGGTEIAEPGFESANNVALGPQGSLPAQSRISKSQVAEVVQQIVRLADNDVLIEAWADPEAPEIDIEEAVLQALPAAAIQEEGSAAAGDEEEAEEEAPAQRPGGFLSNFGTRRIKVAAEEAGDALEEAAPGTRRVKSRAPAFAFGRGQAAEEEEEAPKQGGGFASIFGGPKEAKQAEVGPESARQSAAKGIKAAGKKPERVAAAQSRGAEPEGEKPAKKGLLGALGFGGGTTYVESED